MSFTLAKLIVLPLLQTRKRFSEVYPENWIPEFIDSGLPVSYSIRFGVRDKKELGKIIEYRLDPNSKDQASYVLLMHLSGWVEKYPEKLEVIKERLDQYFTFELDFDGWKIIEGMPKTPEEALKWFITFFEIYEPYVS
jgi:hypothetical protein